MAKKKRDGDLSFPDMVAGGENPNGLVAYTPNGVAHGNEGPGRQQFSYNQAADGNRWHWPDDKAETKMPMTRNRRG